MKISNFWIGFWVLGEPITFLQMVGTVIVLAGVALISWQGNN
jgi:drug/metabolite transporter (DMT)-like permease